MPGNNEWYHAANGSTSEPLTFQESAERLESPPFSRPAGRVYAAAAQAGEMRRGDESIFGGLGDLLDGD